MDSQDLTSKRPNDETLVFSSTIVDSTVLETANKRVKIEEVSATVAVPVTVSLPTANSTSTSLGVTETDVGITEYISADLPGFKGILKQRYTDFLVNEVSLDGTVLHLVEPAPVPVSDKKNRRREKRAEEREGDKDEEKDEKKEEKSEDTEPKNEEANNSEKKIDEKPTFVLSENDKDRLAKYLDVEDIDKIMNLFINGSNMQTKKSFEEKDDRTALHQLIREIFNSKFETKTTPSNNFSISLANAQQQRRSRERVGGIKNAIGPALDYLHFTLYKENKDTMECASLLAKFLRVPPKTIGYAGTKDRRGATVQRASINKMKVDRLHNLNRVLRGIRLGSFKYESEPLKLGDLKGNEFFITIRGVEAAEGFDKVNKAFESLKQHGFINYYGMQRFGTFSVSTHTIGKHMLNDEWDKVIDLLLMPQELGIPDSVDARKKWAATRDPNAVLPLMPKKCVAEHAVLRTLAKDRNNKSSGSLNAVMQIPRNLRVMYVHAYQSYIWNVVTSARVKRFGLNVIEGDLVIDDSEQLLREKEKQASLQSGEVFQEDLKEDSYTRARPVTKEEVESSKYTIYDIVLPTPGFDVTYPENELKQVYVDTMAQDGIDPFNMKRGVREFSLAGSYRYVFSKAHNVEWWVKKYEDPVEQLVKTDLEMINEGLSVGVEGETGEGKRMIQGEGIGRNTGIVLKLQLGVAQYATMALREVMKLDTSRRGECLNIQVKASS
ncbi:tRNA pseudouridine synthase D [Nadsonia fulvescens var. elongata DSM 6958]|uniref:tRNA pseudouridine synthase D n=1 Tax=Nadsonia fulvescens var. elongata DSM 6958 TaxID=857566 RepID=A0A1E3PPM4_9ASCO|nr:tRNA pseudouridine synthase D [Nadsonia fulvescens var. elongata DSM 6958]